MKLLTLTLTTLAALSMQARADIISPDDDMIVVSGQNTSIQMNQDVQILTSEVNPITGKEEITAVEMTDKITGRKMIVGLGETEEVAAFRITVAIRLKYPELFGARVGVSYKDIAELGIDAGLGIFVWNRGAYLNVHPLTGNLQPFYVGLRLQDQYVWRVAYNLIGLRGEAVVGYKWDFNKKNAGGFYGFAEIGVGSFLGNQKAEFFGTKWPVDDYWVRPVVTFGVGYDLTFKKKSK